MARYRRVSTRMWGDAKVRRLTWPPPNGLTLFLRLLTGPETTLLPGVIIAREAGLAEALGWDVEAFRKAFREAFREGLAKADWEAGLVWLPRAILHNPPASPNVVLSWGKVWEDLPDSWLIPEILQAYKAFGEGLGEGFREAFRKAFRHMSPNQEQEQEQEQEQDQLPQKPHEARDDSGQRSIPGALPPDPQRDDGASMRSQRKKPAWTKVEHAKIQRVLNHLADAKGTPRRQVGKTNSPYILKRLRDGVTVEELCSVIDARMAAARNDPQQLQWVNAKTPFRDSNWEMSLSMVESHRAKSGDAPTTNGHPRYQWFDGALERYDGEVNGWIYVSDPEEKQRAIGNGWVEEQKNHG